MISIQFVSILIYFYIVTKYHLDISQIS